MTSVNRNGLLLRVLPIGMSLGPSGAIGMSSFERGGSRTERTLPGPYPRAAIPCC